nr:MAG TPA: hypothetical protein [Caudoviricetes sp.]
MILCSWFNSPRDSVPLLPGALVFRKRLGAACD